MANYELCIDMGSNYTTIYKKHTGVVLREPTIAIIEPSAKTLKVSKIGLEAEKMWGKTGDDEVIVHSVVEGVIKNVELTERILMYFLNKVVKYKLVKPAIKIIVCLPIGLNESEYEDYKKVFYAIGFAKINFVYNIVSASFVDAPFLLNNKASMLVDLGGSKTEIAIVMGGRLISGCTLNVGGNLIDEAIVDYLHSTKGYLLSTQVAGKLKREVGSLYETDKSNMEVLVEDESTKNKISTIISAKDIMRPIYEGYLKIVQAINGFFLECSSEIALDVKNDGIVFFGGGSQITGLENFFKKALKMTVFQLDNPEFAGVLGSEKLFSNPNLLQKVVEEN